MKPDRRMTKRAVSTRHRRGGATLTEVLMALLVMGIGLVSVATLFPLSLLRSVEATKLTNATLTRINAESRIRASVWVDAFGNPINRAIIQDPNKNGAVREHDLTKFVFDPLGWNVFDDDGAAYADGSFLKDSFGGQDSNGDGTLEAPVGISRFNFGITSREAAEAFVSLPDSFVTLADVLGSAATVTSTAVGVNGPSLAEYQDTPVRVTLIRASVPDSLVFQDPAGTPAALAEVKVTGANSVSLPAGTTIAPAFIADIGRVVIETPENRYTWLATVRRFGFKPSVTIAVFFRRAFDPEDEKIYSVNEPAGGYNEFELPTTTTGPLGDLVRPPGLKVGGYMFDVNTFRWLKIASIDEVKPASGTPFIRFTTDPEDVDPSPRPRASFPAMFPNNVVEAYTLKKN